MRVAVGVDGANLERHLTAAVQALGGVDVGEASSKTLVLLGNDLSGVAALAEETGRRVIAGVALSGGPARPVGLEAVVGAAEEPQALAEAVAAAIVAGGDSGGYLIDWEAPSPVEFRALVGALLDALGAERCRPAAGVVSHLAVFGRTDADGQSFRELWAVFAPDNPADEDELVRLLDRAGTTPLRDRLSTRLGPLAHANLLPPELPLCLVVISRRQSEEPRWLAEARLAHPVRIRFLGRTDLERRLQERPVLLRRFFSPAAVALKRQLGERTRAFEEAEARRKEAQRMLEALKREQRARARAERDAVWRELSWRIAHKIGNPTATIDLIEGNLRPYVTDPAGVECLDDLATCVTRITQLLHELRDYAAATGIQLVMTPTQRLHAMIGDATRLFAQRGGHATVRETPPNGAVLLDEEKMRQVFDELFKNAEYWAANSGRTPHITVRYEVSITDTGTQDHSSAAPHTLTVVVKDNGPGIRPDMKERIFTPYVTTRKEGSGHGLAIARTIVENHGGDIVEVGIVGDGATFRLTLPLFEEIA
ncbi:putative sensor histidine kinase [Azospirillum lipoferum 4B]|uniref:histidine kinase n=1 Tax=Azospirillum lipoferum (strain 4B) TaxID=862719 RepID=G7Z1V1_AZOL4|nr:putative sensor histidine kinase [Azospirillum lipoferum 4B]